MTSPSFRSGGHGGPSPPFSVDSQRVSTVNTSSCPLPTGARAVSPYGPYASEVDSYATWTGFGLARVAVITVVSLTVVPYHDSSQAARPRARATSSVDMNPSGQVCSSRADLPLAGAQTRTVVHPSESLQRAPARHVWTTNAARAPSAARARTGPFVSRPVEADLIEEAEGTEHATASANAASDAAYMKSFMTRARSRRTG